MEFGLRDYGIHSAYSLGTAWWTGACAQGCCCVGKSQGEGFSFLEYLCMPPFPPSFSAKSAGNRFLLAWSPLYFTKEGEALPILCQTSSVHVPVMLKNQEAVVGPMEVLHLTPPRVWQGFLRYPRWFPPPHLWCFTPLFFLNNSLSWFSDTLCH